MPRSRSKGCPAFMIGGLVVAVLAMIWAILAGLFDAPTTADMDVDINLPRPTLPEAPSLPDLPRAPPIEPPSPPSAPSLPRPPTT